MSGESRTELLAWLNDLLQLSYTKVEQVGTGAAYCQILDSIYGDVPMARVKFTSKQEYEHLANYKVLQNIFKNHGIDKPIPVDRLVKCKMQDNLEFLQWIKKYWDMQFPGGEYDALARRKGLGGEPSAGPSARAPAPAAARAPAPVKRAPVAAVRPGSRTASTVSDAAYQELAAKHNDQKLINDGLEKERDFYFSKLRDIELIIGARLESEDPSLSEEEKTQLLQMQAILYSTEEGFEVPEGEEEEQVEDLGDEEETF